MTPLKLGIAGIEGRMGQALLGLSARPGTGWTISAASVRPSPACSGGSTPSTGANGIFLTGDPETLARNCDAVIDFTAPEASVAQARACAEIGSVHVIGTTGFTPAQTSAIQAAGSRARIVQSANFSLGVNVLSALVERAAALLDAEYDIEIDEMHHRLKKDSPSGTALLLAASAAKGRGIELSKAHRHYGEGMLGERERGTIGMSARRGGEVVGVHTVTFAGPGETLELTHRAQDRGIYAHGAIKAALWAHAQPPGLYSMRDVLGL